MASRKWADVRAEAVASGRLDEARVAELGRRMLAEVRAFRLKEMRKTLGLSQSEMGARIGVSRSQISKFERGDMNHTEIATVHAFVGALGGEVEIVARFGDERITIG